MGRQIFRIACFQYSPFWWPFPRLPRLQPLGHMHAKRLNIKTLTRKRQKHRHWLIIENFVLIVFRLLFLLKHITWNKQWRSQGGGCSPPIGLSTKMQNKKNTTFLAHLWLFFVLELTKKWFKESFQHIFSWGGANLSKIKTLKNAEKQTLKFDRQCKNAKHRLYQQIYYKLRNKGDGYLVLVNYQSLPSNIFPLAPPQLFFFTKYR